MSLSLPFILSVIWVMVATFVALSPQKYHRPFAVYFLLPSMLVLVPWLWIEHGVWVGLLACAAVASILRWPFYFIGRWVIFGIPPSVPRGKTKHED